MPLLQSADDPHALLQRARVERALRAGGGQASVRVAGIAAGLVTIPLALDTLGQERLGVWLAISSFSLLLGTADLGLGSGIVTAIASADGRGDFEEQRRLVSSGLAALAAVGLLLGVVGTAVALLVPWSSVLGVRDGTTAETELRTAVWITLVGVSIGVVASIGPRVQDGLQQGASVAAWQLLGIAVQLSAAFACWLLDLGLVAFSASAVSGTLVGSVAATLALFARQPAFRPRSGSVRTREASMIGRSGALYFVLALSATLAYQIDTLVIANRLGAASAAEYGVAYRVMAFATLPSAVFLTPFWPAFAEAHAAGDLEWIRRTFRRTVVLSVAAATALGSVLFFLAPYLIDLWTDGAISVPTELLAVLLVFAIMSGIGGPFAVLLNALRVVRLQAVLSVTMALANVALSLALVGRLGITGPPVATVLVQGLVILGPTGFIVHRQLGRFSSPSSMPHGLR